MAEIELRVTFTGLCLFLVQDDCKRVGVVLPDYRHGVMGALGVEHPDGDHREGAHHVGYVRIAGAHIASALAGDEVIHRLNREEIRFDIPDVNDLMKVQTILPAMERVAPHPGNPVQLAGLEQDQVDCSKTEQSLLAPAADLFTASAPVVGRIRLTGGSVVGSGSNSWIFPPVLDPTRPPYKRVFAEKVTWTREFTIPDPQPGQPLVLNMTLTPLGGSTSKTIPLMPVVQGGKNVVAVKVANLCADNPLEWSHFAPPKPQREDHDFKLLYKVLKPADGRSYADFLQGKWLPVPERDPTGPVGVENCIGMKITVPAVG